jgi:MoaA/NifB/PqqE/SkfB family radical SAM enzyme
MTNQQRPLKQDEIEKRNLLKKEKPYVYEKIMKFDEKVKRGESIAILQFQYNYRCNFGCQHCEITGLRDNKKKKRSFTPDDVKELSRQADELGLAHIVITGGEPLVFPDFDDIVKAIDPQKFYITSDTNGWFLDAKRARHLKSIGVDKIQLSLDSLSASEHDEFRRKPGSHKRCLRAIDAALEAGLNIIIQTVVTKQRVRSQEFIEFLEFLNGKGVGVCAMYAKPVGEWEGNYDVLINKDDMNYLRELEKKYNVFTHLTPSYGLNLGCIAVKRMVSITKYGDIMPCPYIHTSLGNFFEEPLKDIIERGLRIKYFGKYVDTCLIAEDRKFINGYVVKKIYGKLLPVPYSEIFTNKDDFIDETQHCIKDESTENLLSWRR